MANIPSSPNYLNDIEINSDQPITQSLKTRIGASINDSKDRLTINEADIVSLGDLVGAVKTTTSHFTARTTVSVDDTITTTNAKAIRGITLNIYDNSNTTHSISVNLNGGFLSDHTTIYTMGINGATVTLSIEGGSGQTLRLNYGGSGGANHDLYLETIYIS